MNHFGKTEDFLPYDSLLKLAFENEVMATIVSLTGGKIVTANTAAKILFGYSEAEFGSLMIADLLAPGCGSNLISGEVKYGIPIETLPFIRKNGELFNGKTSVQILAGNNGTDYVYISLIEINQQQPVDAPVKLTSVSQDGWAQFKNLIENLPVGVLKQAPDASILISNNAALELLGLTEEQLLGKTSFDPDWSVIHEDGSPFPGHTHPVPAAIATGKSVKNVIMGVYRPLKKDRVWLLVNAEPEFDATGKLDHVICTFDNFTEQIITRRKLKENEAHLIALNASLEAKTAALINKNTELESFAYVASHDLQEPLRMVSGFIKLFEKKYENIVDETGKKYIQFAVDGAERMKTLINNLLKYALIAKVPETVTDVDMNAVVKEVLYTFSSDGNQTEREIDVEKLPVIRAGKNDMLQLMQNLIGNALKYATDERQIIRISGTETATEYTISVQDNGIGIDPIDSERIFIMFQRLVSQDKFSGTGIGLATCKKIVELYGGKIWVESELGKGANFTFSIPKRQAV